MNISIREPLSFSGIGKKDNQEDYLWPNPETVSFNDRIFILCDGVGGHERGEVASKTVATALGSFLAEHLSNDVYITRERFREAIDFAYDKLDEIDTDTARKMGTTMTCLVFHRGGVIAAHIGDSRIYHLRPPLSDRLNRRTGIIYQSSDHSLVNDLLKIGEITEEEAQNFHQKNLITRAMQPHLEQRFEADMFTTRNVQDGDYFFLCSDGVLELLTNETLGCILSDLELDDEGKIKAIKTICDEQTYDNYSCWLIHIDKVEINDLDYGADEEEAIITVEQEVSLPLSSLQRSTQKKKQSLKSTSFFDKVKHFIKQITRKY